MVGATRVLPLDDGRLVGRLNDLSRVRWLMNNMGLVVCRLNDLGLTNVVRRHVPSMGMMAVARFRHILGMVMVVVVLNWHRCFGIRGIKLITVNRRLNHCLGRERIKSKVLRNVFVISVVVVCNQISMQSRVVGNMTLFLHGVVLS